MVYKRRVRKRRGMRRFGRRRSLRMHHKKRFPRNKLKVFIKTKKISSVTLMDQDNFYTLQPTLQSLYPDYSTMGLMYEEYKIRKLVIKFSFNGAVTVNGFTGSGHVADSNQTPTPYNVPPMLGMFRDYDLATTSYTWDEFMAQEGCKTWIPKELGSSKTIIFSPKIHAPVWVSTISSGYTMKLCPWLRTVDNTVPMYGMQYASHPLSPGTGLNAIGALRIETTAYIQFRDRTV